MIFLEKIIWIFAIYSPVVAMIYFLCNDYYVIEELTLKKVLIIMFIYYVVILLYYTKRHL